MLNTVSQLQPTSLWKHFSQLNAIPRASQKEEQVIEFIKDFGHRLGLETIEDNTGNVLIKKPATKGMEAKATVILQGHLDMVHQKNADTVFDFATQGINMYVEGDWVKAKGTTLGADNGIGVAAMMTVLAATDLVHPAIEAIFTVDEEVGMTGAMGLKKDFLTGAILLNLDSEEDNILTVGSAGGVDVVIEGTYPLEELSREFKSLYVFLQLSVEGLTGGHSGVDIHRGRCNAIKLLTRVVYEINQKCPLRISSIEGGTMTSAIPRECKSILAIRKNEVKCFFETVHHWQDLLKTENTYSDPDLKLTCSFVEARDFVLHQEVQQKILASLYTCPSGIYRMTPALNNLVQSSNNIGKINIGEGTFRIGCLTRSFIESERADLVNVLRNCFLSLAPKITEVGAFPGWNPAPHTATVTTMKKIYESLFNKPPEIDAIHAGLECGILAETYPHLEMVSIGPNVEGAHSPEEALQISSTQKFWKYLTTILKEL